MFETHALTALSSGGTFDAFNLTTRERGTLRFPRSESRRFHDWAELRAAADAAAVSGSPVTLVLSGVSKQAADAVLTDAFGGGRVLVNVGLNDYRNLVFETYAAALGITVGPDARGSTGGSCSAGIAPVRAALDIYPRQREVVRMGGPARQLRRHCMHGRARTAGWPRAARALRGAVHPPRAAPSVGSRRHQAADAQLNCA